ISGNTSNNSLKLFKNALKGIEHILNRQIDENEKMINYIVKDSNRNYLEYILWCIKELHKSLDHNIRLRCANLLNILMRIDGYIEDSNLEEIRQVLMSDSRKSIRNIAAEG
ncbi:MAG: hypothetical protein J1F01_03575, partial [Oscillospiraceae bacterium]|nr:hypothetical protein [Oscillospiraceae bacterium]